jgi:hypothetical protein
MPVPGVARLEHVVGFFGDGAKLHCRVVVKCNWPTKRVKMAGVCLEQRLHDVILSDIRSPPRGFVYHEENGLQDAAAIWLQTGGAVQNGLLQTSDYVQQGSDAAPRSGSAHISPSF